MRIFEEVVYQDDVEVQPNSTSFIKSTLVWLYWNGNERRWKWSRNSYPHIDIQNVILNKDYVYYFVYSDFISCLYFLYVRSISEEKWYKSFDKHDFPHMTKSEIVGQYHKIHAGEKHQIFVFDENGPYMRNVYHPSETFTEKSWRVLTSMIPFRK